MSYMYYVRKMDPELNGSHFPELHPWRYWENTPTVFSFLHSQKLTVRTWQEAGTQKETHLPTLVFLVFRVICWFQGSKLLSFLGGAKTSIQLFFLRLGGEFINLPYISRGFTNPKSPSCNGVVHFVWGRAHKNYRPENEHVPKKEPFVKRNLHLPTINFQGIPVFRGVTLINFVSFLKTKLWWFKFPFGANLYNPQTKATKKPAIQVVFFLPIGWLYATSTYHPVRSNR